MISKRVTSFFRRITVCLTISLVSFLFVLSCQKDEGLKQKDPNALTKSQAKEYFEQTASTLKFLTTGTTPAGTKNADYSLTENMIIEWDQAIEGETANSYIVEIPIRMVSPVTALLYDGIGHFNKNIRQVQMNTSLLIEKHKADGCFHHSVVTTVGSYSTTVNSKYGFLCDKSSFSGYQIFSAENGKLLNTMYYNHGDGKMRTLYTENQIPKVDSLGVDLIHRGIAFCFSKLILTKGDAGGTSGEDSICPSCGGKMTLTNYGTYIHLQCACGQEIIVFIDISDCCSECNYPIQLCQCICSVCGYPNRNGNICACEANNGGSVLYGEDTTNVGVYEPLSLIINISGSGTVEVSPNRVHYPGDNVTLTANPASGYYFGGWYENNLLIGTNLSKVLYMDGDKTILAVFIEED